MVSGGGGRAAWKLWDVQKRRELAAIAAHNNQVYGLAFDPRGQWFASGSWDTTIRLWDAKTRRPIATLRRQRDAGFDPQPVVSLASSPDGKSLGVAFQDGSAASSTPNRAQRSNRSRDTTTR